MTKVDWVLPPAELVRYCPELKTKPLVTNKDLIDERAATRVAYEQCAAKVRALHTWRAQHSRKG